MSDWPRECLDGECPACEGNQPCGRVSHCVTEGKAGPVLTMRLGEYTDSRGVNVLELARLTLEGC